MSSATPPIDTSKGASAEKGDTYDTARATKEAEDLKKLIDGKKEAMATPSKEGEKKEEEGEKKELTEEEQKAADEAKKKEDEEKAAAKAAAHEEEQLAEAVAKFGDSMSKDAVYEKIKARQEAASEEKPLTSDEFDKEVEKLTSLYQARMWPHALETAIDAVAVLEGLPPEQVKLRTGMMGTHETDKVVVRHNLAAVLHQVGYYDAAQHFYNEAKSGMTAWKDPNWFSKCCGCDGQLKKQRLEFIGEMMQLVAEKKKPASTKYLSEDGEQADWANAELDDAIKKVKEDIFGEKEKEEGGEAEAPAAAPAAAPANGNGHAVKAS